MNCDADLYSSTVTVLNKIEPWLTPGSFIYFDEFDHRYDEMRAFAEFLDRTGMRFELYAASRDLAHAAFRVVPGASGGTGEVRSAAPPPGRTVASES